MNRYPGASERSISPIPFTYSSATSSCDTVHGIGSVAGKLILSVGELALRGIEAISVQRAIFSIHNMVVSSEGKATLDDKVYSNLLELSR